MTSKEGIKTMPRGVRPGDRWAVLEKTSPSGKTLFRCMSCGDEGPTQPKFCWKLIEERDGGGSREVNLECATWQPMKLFNYWLPNDPNLPGQGWARIIVSDTGYFSTVSDYGNYGFFWSHHGYQDFRQFLVNAHKSWDYFAGKFSMDTGKRYDKEKTYRSVKDHILQCRKGGLMTKEEAHFEWWLLHEDCSKVEGLMEFGDWIRRTRISDAWEHQRESYSTNLEAFCKRTLKRLSDILEVDLKREGLVGARR